MTGDGNKLQYINETPAMRRRWRTLTIEKRRQLFAILGERPSQKEMERACEQLRREDRRRDQGREG